MGLIKRIRHRVGYVWWWRWRYWWLDTPHGVNTRRMLLALALLTIVVNTIEAAIAARTPDPLHPHQAFYWMIVWLIVAVLVGVAIAMSSGAKPAAPTETNKAPTTKDGRSAVRHYGTCWVDDPAQLAWKVLWKEPIKSDGGGK